MSTHAATRSGNGLILTGLLMGVLLAALDQTVIGTAIPRIVGDIGGLERVAWLFSAYLLATAIVIPISGKMSDLYGRRPVYMIGMGTFLLGSALCGLAGSAGTILGMDGMTQLVLARAVQGLGGGAIFPVAIATIADLYPPSERGRVMGIFGAAFGLSSVLGPFIGGAIVDNAHVGSIESWRWVFYVNLPLGIAAIAMVSAFFPRTAATVKPVVDYLGIATLTIALLSGLLALVGYEEGWAATALGTLGALSLASLGAFVVIERRAEDPVLPPLLFRNPIFAVSAVIAFLSGAAMFTVLVFLPTYLQGVVGMSATYAGTVLIPLSMGIVAGSAGSGPQIKRFGYKPFILAGFVITLLGYVLLSRLGAHPPVWLTLAELAFFGIGIGLTIQTVIIAAQNAVDRRYIGATTSGITLFRTLGATIGVTVMGTLLNRQLARNIPEQVEPSFLASLLANPLTGGRLERVPEMLLQPDALADVALQPGGAAAIEGIKLAFADSLAVVFLVGAAISLVALLVTTRLQSIPMKTAADYAAATLAGDAAADAGATTAH